ncbi:MAG: N-acetylmuramoyl-L-alanine amidase [Eggerthellaceae bacterium]|nr:N-acetylmuramoyl-L-alanine amidase [Eggerthellaceae bacterium]
MRIIIDMGHTPTSPGASGYLDELSCDREAGKRIIAELKRRGHTVYDSTPPDNVAYPYEVNQRCAYANSLENIDLFCSLHLNAGGGHGAEVLYYSGDSHGREYAEAISANVAKALGIANRGAKPNDWVGVICNVHHNSVLIEFCFVDSYDDAQAWWACPWERLVNAVCDAIEGTGYQYDDGEDDMRPADVWEYSYKDTAPGGNMYNAVLGMYDKVEALAKKVDALSTKVDKVQAGNVDYAKLAKAVNDDAAARMKA